MTITLALRTLRRGVRFCFFIGRFFEIGFVVNVVKIITQKIIALSYSRKANMHESKHAKATNVAY